MGPHECHHRGYVSFRRSVKCSKCDIIDRIFCLFLIAGGKEAVGH